MNCTKNRTPVHMLSNNGLCPLACAVCVAIFSNGGKFRLVSNFMELHALTQADHSYVLLVLGILNFKL